MIFVPLDFIARFAALVPRPRVNLTYYHGEVASNNKNRIIPAPDLLVYLKVELRHELAGLRKPIIQTLGCTDRCGSLSFTLHSGIGLIGRCGKNKISPR